MEVELIKTKLIGPNEVMEIELPFMPNSHDVLVIDGKRCTPIIVSHIINNGLYIKTEIYI